MISGKNFIIIKLNVRHINLFRVFFLIICKFSVDYNKLFHGERLLIFYRSCYDIAFGRIVNDFVLAKPCIFLREYVVFVTCLMT